MTTPVRASAVCWGPDWSTPFAWVVDADGKEIVTIAAREWTRSAWPDTIQPSEFALFLDGAAVGRMNAKMSSIEAPSGANLSITQSRWLAGRYVVVRSGASTTVLADAVTWCGLAATYCRCAKAQ